MTQGQVLLFCLVWYNLKVWLDIDECLEEKFEPGLQIVDFNVTHHRGILDEGLSYPCKPCCLVKVIPIVYRNISKHTAY